MAVIYQQQVRRCSHAGAQVQPPSIGSQQWYNALKKERERNGKPKTKREREDKRQTKTENALRCNACCIARTFGIVLDRRFDFSRGEPDLYSYFVHVVLHNWQLEQQYKRNDCRETDEQRYQKEDKRSVLWTLDVTGVLEPC